MSELLPTTADTTDKDTNNSLDDAIDMQIKDASRRMILEEHNHSELHSKELEEHETECATEQKKAIKALGVVAGVGAAGVLAIGAANYIAEPQPSEESVKITVQPGDGLQSIAEQIPGSEKDIRAAIDSIAGDPANIDVLKDGLQAGEQITVPIHFK